MKHFLTFGEFSEVNESYNQLLESTVDVYKNLVSINPDLMRRVFNVIVKKGYKISVDTPYTEMSPKDALKLKDDTALKIWSKDNIIQIMTLGNDVMDSSFCKKSNKDLGSTMIKYFYKTSFFGSDEAYDYIKANGTKIKDFLLSCDSVIIFNIDDLKSGAVVKKISDKVQELITKFADKFNIPVYDDMQGKNPDIDLKEIIDKKDPAFIYNIGFNFPDGDSRGKFKEDEPSTKEIPDKDVISLMRSFIQRIPIDRDNKNSTQIVKTTGGGLTKFYVEIYYDTLVPNPGLIQELIDKSGLVPSKSFYSKFFANFTIVSAPSKKAAQMATSDWWTAFVNSHVNDSFNRALDGASDAVKQKAREFGKQTLLMAKNGLTDRPDFKQFFTDVLMYYTKADKLQGEQLDIFSETETKIIFK